MMNTRESKPALIGIGSFLAASLGVTVSAAVADDEELFLAESLENSDNILHASHDEEGECGDDEDGDDSDEGECGEGECGDHEEGECGEGKCGDMDDEEEEEEEENKEE